MPETTRLRRVVGRDPNEDGRVASQLELFFDLTFAFAFSTAGAQAAHMAAAGHPAQALLGFAFVMFGTIWAWINFTWMASAFDTDDWLFRLLTMVQMVGVLVFAAGMPATFHSIEEGTHLDNTVIVLGYVIMRLGLVGHWIRAYRDSPENRRTARFYAIGVSIVQVGWVAMIFLHLSLPLGMACSAVLIVAEVAVPWVAERQDGGSPWHPHHIAERYGLLVIITLGESIIGTGSSLIASAEEHGWTAETILLALVGVLLAFTMWWSAFLTPWGEVLERRPEFGFVFGYGHMLIFVALAALGAGLHLAQYDILGESAVGRFGTSIALVGPVAVFLAMIYALYTAGLGHHRYHVLLGVLDVVVLAAALALGLGGASVVVVAGVTALAPLVTVIGYEHRGRAHMTAALERMDAHEGGHNSEVRGRGGFTSAGDPARDSAGDPDRSREGR